MSRCRRRPRSSAAAAAPCAPSAYRPIHSQRLWVLVHLCLLHLRRPGLAFQPMATATGVRKIGERVERKDLWWIEPLIYVVVLGGFVLYATWASLVNANYFLDPYLSPFYSPCLAQNCVHPTLPLLGSWWNLSPAILIVGSPLAFRVTCYYYRRSYYRGFFLSPPACLVPDAPKKYSGETKLPFLIQNFHRYALYISIPVLLILWWHAIQAL